LLTNLTYDVGLTIRLAQNYGINIKQFNSNSGSSFLPYGVHFDKANAPKSFILFADTTSDGLYNDDGNADLSSCTKSNEVSRGCVSKYNIMRGNYISKLCVDGEAPANCNVNKLDIVFKRPNPDAYIRADNNQSALKTNATIFLSGADGSTRKVRVGNNGLIEVVH
jgi:hypothetical protein